MFKQFSDNANFKRWLTDSVFEATYLSQVKGDGSGLDELRARAEVIVRYRFGDAAVWPQAVRLIFRSLASQARGGALASDLVAKFLRHQLDNAPHPFRLFDD